MTKNIIILLLNCFFVVTISAQPFQDPTNRTQKKTPPTPETALSLSKEIFNISSEAGIDTLKVTTDASNWEFKDISADWLNCKKEGMYLLVTYKENTGASPRECTFKIKAQKEKAKEKEQTVKVIQAAAKLQLNISKDEIKFQVKGGRDTIVIRTNTNSDNLSLSQTMVDWCDVEKTFTTIYISCHPNTKKAERSFSFDITAGSEKRTISVKQNGISLEVTPKKINFFQEGGSEKINVVANIDNWSIDTTKTNLTNGFNIEEKGEDFIIITTDKNNSITPYTGKITIKAGEDAETTVKISQDATPIRLSIDIDTVEFTGLGGSQPILINTNVADSLKIIIPPTSHFSAEILNSDYILIKAPKNDFKSDKTEIINIKADTATANIVVYQKKCEYWTRVTKEHWHFVGLSAGWVTKNWKYSDDGSVWGIFEKDSRVNGFQAGLRIDPYFKPSLFGLGIHTGIYYNYYQAKSLPFNNVNNREVHYEFKEHTLTVPLHLNYRIDFDNKGIVGIFFHGGLNFDVGVSGKIKEIFNDSYYSSGNVYQENIYDKLGCFDMAFGYGAGFYLRRCMFEFNGYSGLLNHSKNTDYQLRQNSYLAVTFSLMFNSYY